MAKEQQEIAKKNSIPSKEYAIIRLPEANGNGEDETVFVGGTVGKHYLKRNQLIPVHKGIIENLRNAKRPQQEKETTSDDQILTTYKEVPRFTFELVRWVSKEVYESLKAIAKKRPLTENEVWDA